MDTDTERYLRAVRARDARFDGHMFTAVRTTGIYCRPSCPATTPRAENVTFYPSAAAAQRAGYRACKRCRPDATPGSAAWAPRADAAARAVRLIADGVVDREGVAGLAAQLGYSVRQLERLLLAELGAGPLALARAQRTSTARTLLEVTSLPMAEVAFAAGFSSIRAFNRAVREVYDTTPTALRAASAATSAVGDDGRVSDAAVHRVVLRLPVRAPFDAAALFEHLGVAAVPGVEEVRDGAYRRTLRLPRGVGIAALQPAGTAIACTLYLSDLRDLTAAVTRCRTLLDLDADPVEVDAALRADPSLAPAVVAAPGRRIPRTVDPDEQALRLVLGQQVSRAAARTQAAGLTVRYGEAIDDPDGGLTHLFPTAAALADADLSGLPLPRARSRALHHLASALAAGTVDLSPGCDRQRSLAVLGALPGIGPWTVALTAMRALGDPDAFPTGDLVLRRGAAALGLAAAPGALEHHAARWRPWRAYAAQHLWAAGLPGGAADRCDDTEVAA